MAKKRAAKTTKVDTKETKAEEETMEE